LPDAKIASLALRLSLEWCVITKIETVICSLCASTEINSLYAPKIIPNDGVRWRQIGLRGVGEIALPRKTIHENTRLLSRKIYGIDVILFPWTIIVTTLFFFSHAIRTAFSAEGEFLQMIPRSRCIRKQFFIDIGVWHFNYTERTILLDTDLKILLNHQNNFVGILKIIGNAAKNFNILTTSLSVLHNYFDSSTKLLFWLCIQLKILDLSAKLFFPCRTKIPLQNSSTNYFPYKNINCGLQVRFNGRPLFAIELTCNYARVNAQEPFGSH